MLNFTTFATEHKLLVSMRFFIFAYVVIFFLFSCEKESKTHDFKPINDTIQLAKNKPIIHAIGISLNEESAGFVKDWKEFQAFDTALRPYFAITQSNALLNASNLSQKAELLLESVRQPELQQPATISRFNLLTTECKRLADMADIKAIQPKEVTLQIQKIIEAYSALNAKLNSIVDIKKKEAEVQIDPDFQRILQKTPTLDTLTQTHTARPTVGKNQPLHPEKVNRLRQQKRSALLPKKR